MKQICSMEMKINKWIQITFDLQKNKKDREDFLSFDILLLLIMPIFIIGSSYSHTFAMKTVHNTTLIKNISYACHLQVRIDLYNLNVM